MSHKTKRKIFLILPILTLAVIICQPVLALTVSETGLETTAGEADLPETDVPSIVGRIIAGLFSAVGLIFFLLLIYGGLLWMTSRGNEQNVTKAKELLISAVIGLLIVLAGYAISRFVISLLLGGPEVPPTP